MAYRETEGTLPPSGATLSQLQTEREANLKPVK